MIDNLWLRYLIKTNHESFMITFCVCISLQLEPKLLDLDQIVQKLEAANPTKEPLKSPFLDGKWELIYTTSQSILQTKVSQTRGSSFDNFSYLINGLLTKCISLQRPKFLRSRVNYQAINVDTLRAQNMESFPTFNQVSIFVISNISYSYEPGLTQHKNLSTFGLLYLLTLSIKQIVVGLTSGPV